MDDITLVNGDFLIQGREMVKQGLKFDAIIADPPYGQTTNKFDKEIPFEEMWRILLQLRKDKRTPIILFAQDGKNLFASRLRLSNPKMFRYTRYWNKVLVSGHLNANRQPMKQIEDICVFYEKQCTYNPQMTEGKPQHSKGVKYVNKEIKNQNYGFFKQLEDNRAGSTLKYPKQLVTIQKTHPSKAIHRTEKPVPLMEDLVKTYTNEGEIVLDFTMGSGTTGEACINTNRKFWGIELNSEDYDIATERLSRRLKKY